MTSHAQLLTIDTLIAYNAINADHCDVENAQDGPKTKKARRQKKRAERT